MRQTTLPEQTAKLIELGFDRPKNRVIKQLLDRSTDSWIMIGEEGDYSIGELIEILKPIKNLKISVYNSYNDLEDLIIKRLVNNEWEILFGAVGEDLIDLLFSAIVKLKEDGVI